MSGPNISFLFNHGSFDSPYTGDGEDKDFWKVIDLSDDKLIFTGGGIMGLLDTPTCVSGTRDATIRPSIEPFIIPQTYIEKDIMYNVPLAGNTPNRYVFALHIDGVVVSDMYMEAYDSTTFSTTNLDILSGTTNNNFNSCINAIRTTHVEPPWDSYGWNGDTNGATYLRGSTNRIGLYDSTFIENTVLYYNIYVELPTDIPTFYDTPVISFRYLYV